MASKMSMPDAFDRMMEDSVSDELRQKLDEKGKNQLKAIRHRFKNGGSLSDKKKAQWLDDHGEKVGIKKVEFGQYKVK